MTDVEALRQALDYPWDKWIVFLHPAQRHVVVLDVLDHFVDGVLGSFEPSDAWDDNLVRLHLLFRERFLTHPGIARSLAEAENSPPAAHRAAGIVIGELERAGLRGLQCLDYYRVLTSLMFGASIMDGSTVDDAQWEAWSRFFRYIDDYTPPVEIRTIEGARAQADEAYRLGLDAVIAAIRATAATND